METKISTPLEVLCEGFPAEFVTDMTYCKNLRFDETPDYAFLRRILKDLFFREGYQYDFVFDWTISTCKSIHDIANDMGESADAANPGVWFQQEALGQGGKEFWLVGCAAGLLAYLWPPSASSFRARPKGIEVVCF